MPCAGQPRLLPCPCRIGSPLTPTSPRSITSLKARRAHQLSATQASLQPLPAGAAGTGLASQSVVSQQATRIERATPNHRLEEHGCRPHSPGHIQQVGMDVLAHRIKAPVPDVKYPAVSVDLDANAADERTVFVFDDEILIVG